MSGKRDHPDASPLPGAAWAPAGQSTRAQARFRAEHADPLREAAREVTRYLIADGLVRPRPDACEGCGVTGRRIVTHHLDYLRPEAIAWLCDKCHVAWHRPIDWRQLWADADHTLEAAS